MLLKTIKHVVAKGKKEFIKDTGCFAIKLGNKNDVASNRSQSSLTLSTNISLISFVARCHNQHGRWSISRGQQSFIKGE